MKNKQKNHINWRSGNGTTVLCAGILFVCFFFILFIFQQFTVFRAAVKTQVVADAVADGAAVYGAYPRGIDKRKIETKLNQLVSENKKCNPNVNINLDSYEIKKDRSRRGFKDHILSVNLSGNVGLLDFGDDNYTNHASAKVKIFSIVPQHVIIDEVNSKIIAEALSKCDPDSPQYKAIERSLDYYGWRYSQPMRWVEGARDCSSLVLSCYRDYTDVFKHDHGYTQTIWNDAKEAGVLTPVNEQDLINGTFTHENLEVGDILLWRGEWAADLHRNPPALGHTGIYLGVSSIDGQPKIIHASSSAGGVCVASLPGMHGGKSTLLGVVRIPK